MSVMTNLIKMVPNLKPLQKQPPVLLNFLRWINKETPNFSGSGDMSGIGVDTTQRLTKKDVKLKVIGNGQYVTSPSLWDSINILNQSDIIPITRYTVQTSNIIAKFRPKPPKHTSHTGMKP
jgi:predicted membrane protein